MRWWWWWSWRRCYYLGPCGLPRRRRRTGPPRVRMGLRRAQWSQS
ncbi:unnamed protein product [Spirodela intermedia]|uniref:Uncharacterized protein n=1 Tax=Spirodela intermedia TaxID=51605 RepID=A0A7I8LHD2_SPIIN|nr:unnamed protein product [Spirodela intermedia]